MNSIEKLRIEAQKLENRFARKDRHWPKNPLKQQKAFLDWQKTKNDLIRALKELIAAVECRDNME